jgi:hypothetical protein
MQLGIRSTLRLCPPMAVSRLRLGGIYEAGRNNQGVPQLGGETEPIGPSAPNKLSKLLTAGIVTRQTTRGTRKEDCEKGIYQ